MTGLCVDFRKLWFALVATVGLIGFAASSALALEEEDEDLVLQTVEMKPFVLTLRRKGQPASFVTIRVDLEVQKDASIADITYRRPQLRADFTAALTALSRQAFSINRPIDPNLVSAYLKPYADKRLGPGQVAIYVVEANIVTN